MRALDRKLVRDLWRVKGQVASIALVIACGIASYVSLESSRTSLDESKTAYYERYRFGDVFARMVRAPEAVADRLRRVEGVAVVATRVVREVTLPLPDRLEPPSARLVSLPDRGAPLLNGVHIRRGRLPAPASDSEVVVAEAFAKANDIGLGDRIPAIINGNRRDLSVVGIGLSPEYVFSLSPTDIAADDTRFGILWIRRRALATAFEMDGAFNDVTIKLARGANETAVVRALDHIIEPYGGFGAVSRERQPSNFILEGELTQLDQFAGVAPVIFLAVAAFLLNIVLSQLIGLQRQQIAALRALGYSNGQVVFHFLALALTIVFIGSVAGVLLGAWFGELLTGVYARFFTFPVLLFEVQVSTAITAVGISALAGVIGAIASVVRVARLPPAEALRPAAPPTYRRASLASKKLASWLGPMATMVVREFVRRPVRLGLSSLAIGAAIGIVIVGRFSSDAFESLIVDSLERERPADVSLSFLEPVAPGVIAELEAQEGVLDAEGHRIVGVRFHAGHQHRDGAILGLPSRPRLRRLVDRNANFFVPPPSGLAISRKLAELLNLRAGDRIRLEFLAEDIPDATITVSMLVDDTFGLQGYMELDRLAALRGENVRYSNVELVVDPNRIEHLLGELANTRTIASISRPAEVITAVRKRSGTSMLVMTFVLTLFGVAIAVGVVYNNARVALSKRKRDLASLRVLGFTRREISSVLLGELTLQMVLALPIGMLLGRWWVAAMMGTTDPETFRMPFTVSGGTYSFAITVALIAGVTSALLVRRKLDRLDLIGVLKTRE